jgi:histidine triad (HIT) family protein
VSPVPRHEPPGYACPFCAVVRGEDNAPHTVQRDVVERTDVTTAWIGSRWWERNPGHVILVPNDHVENMYGLMRDLAAEIHETARRIALALRDAYGCDGISTRQHNEPGGDQEVWHYHLHVFPRYVGDGLYGAPWRDTTAAEREPYAAKLRRALHGG